MILRWIVVAITAVLITSISANAVFAAPKKKFRAVQTWKQAYAEDWARDRINQSVYKLDKNKLINTGKGAGITIYVIDTGVGPDDCHGHGTVVASMAAGERYGIAADAGVISVKALDCLGSGTEQQVKDAVDWVYENADPATSVVNMSLGGPPTPSVDTAVARLAAIMPVVVAAGNDSTNACNVSPARVPAAITVAGYDRMNFRSIFSNYGPCVDVWAPGSAIDGVDKNGNRVQWSGTSMSTALVSGAIAYLADQHDLTTLDAAAKMRKDAARPYLIDARLVGKSAYAVWIKD
jgi:subtilisin family serine protease